MVVKVENATASLLDDDITASDVSPVWTAAAAMAFQAALVLCVLYYVREATR
jgi:hypothetical protein